LTQSVVRALVPRFIVSSYDFSPEMYFEFPFHPRKNAR
jgi:hypothetical protein